MYEWVRDFSQEGIYGGEWWKLSRPLFYAVVFNKRGDGWRWRIYSHADLESQGTYPSKQDAIINCEAAIAEMVNESIS